VLSASATCAAAAQFAAVRVRILYQLGG